MTSEQQITIAFQTSSPEQRAEPRRLVLILDHRTLLESLQDEWVRPPQNAPGHLVSVNKPRCFFLIQESPNSILVSLSFDISLLPKFQIYAKRTTGWDKITLSELNNEDEMVFYNGFLPIYALSEISVRSDEERLRLTSLMRQFSNITPPDVPVKIEHFSGIVYEQDIMPKIAAPLTDHQVAAWDAFRGAVTIAFWAVPRVDPWLDLLMASLSPVFEPQLPALAAHVRAPWWSVSPWQHKQDSVHHEDFQTELWRAACKVFKFTDINEAWRPDEIVLKIKAEIGFHALNEYQREIDQFTTDSLSLLRAESVIKLDNWHANPVSKAIQLLLLRPTPAKFATWHDDLPEISPVVWWTGATLAGLLQGYRRMDTHFRGDAKQRKFLALLSLWFAAGPDILKEWPYGLQSKPSWQRRQGRLFFLWESMVWAEKQETARGRWFAADYSNSQVQSAASSLARRMNWPSYRQSIVIADCQIPILGPGNATIEKHPMPTLCIQGTIRMLFNSNTKLEDFVDPEEFRRDIATEGGAGNQIPLPPGDSQGKEVLPDQNSTPKREDTQSLEQAIVPGLIYTPAFISQDEEKNLIHIIDSSLWLDVLKRRVQHYGWKYDYKARQVDPSMYIGELPDWAKRLADRLVSARMLPHLPDQVIVNEYVGNQGISKHIDCRECFADGVAIISLIESWEMVFRAPDQKRKEHILLDNRSVAVLTRDARYLWTHEIPARAREPWGPRKRRVSITFRKVIAHKKPKNDRR